MRSLLLFGFIFILFGGCSKLDPKIAVPSYLQIDDYDVVIADTTDNMGGGQGTKIQKFTDVLVSSRTKNYGYYPIPGKIPLPLTGNTDLIIRPVIRVNGLNAVKVDYPLMKGADTNHALIAGQITKFKPVFKYYPTVKFPFLESFVGTGGGSLKIKNSNPSDTFCVWPGYTYSPSFDGPCLFMKMDGTHYVCQAQSFEALTLPSDGTNLYIEINYKCNTAFEVGVIGTTNPVGPITGTYADQRSAGGATPSDTWKKLYINITDIVRIPPTHPYYYIYFYSTYDVNQTLNQIYIDNIKVVQQY